MEKAFDWLRKKGQVRPIGPIYQLSTSTQFHHTMPFPFIPC